jgi:acid phosphatase class B
MKKIALALSALLVLNVAAMAADAPAAAATTTTKTTKTTTVKAKAPAEMKTRGEVVSVDAVANTLTLKGKKADVTYAVAATAKISSGKKEVKLADITAGSKVGVTYMKDGATMTASAIKVMPAMKKVAKAPAPAAAPAK